MTRPVGGFLLCHGGLHRTLGPLFLVSATAFQVDLSPQRVWAHRLLPSWRSVWRELLPAGGNCSSWGGLALPGDRANLSLCTILCFQQWICEVLGFGEVGRRAVSWAKEKHFLPVSPLACFQCPDSSCCG